MNSQTSAAPLKSAPQVSEDRKPAPRLAPIQMTVAQAFQVGEKLQADGEWEKALLLYKTAVEKDPSHSPSWVNMGAIFALLGRYSLASSCHKAAYSCSPDNPAMCINYANSLRLDGREKEAIALMDDVVNEGVRPFNLCLNLGLSYMGLGRYEKALQCLEEAAEKKAQDLQVHQALGICRMVSGEMKTSLAHLSQAEVPDPLYEMPLWQGEWVDGKTLFIHGLREEELFLSLGFLPRVKERVGRVVLQVPASLTGFFATWPGVNHVVTADQPKEEVTAYDYQMTYLGVLHAFHEDADAFKNTHLTDIKIDLSNFLKQNNHLKVGLWIENSQKFLPVSGGKKRPEGFLDLETMDYHLLNPQ